MIAVILWMLAAWPLAAIAAAPILGRFCGLAERGRERP